MATVAAGVIADPRRYEECFWWLVRDTAGKVVGAAFRTTPHVLGLGPMPNGAATAIAEYVVNADAELPGLIGLPVLVGAFTDAFTASVGRGAPRFRIERRDVLYAVDRLIPPTVPGEAGVATEADLVLAEAWLADFATEIDGARPEPDEASRAALLGVLRDGRLHWWRDRGEIVSMAGHNVTVTARGVGVTRVGPVFTPRSKRRQGYAAGVTAAVTARLLDAGSRVMLFADESNATSNAVYRSLGYQPVDVLVLARAHAVSAA